MCLHTTPRALRDICMLFTQIPSEINPFILYKLPLTISTVHRASHLLTCSFLLFHNQEKQNTRTNYNALVMNQNNLASVINHLYLKNKNNHLMFSKIKHVAYRGINIAHNISAS